MLRSMFGWTLLCVLTMAACGTAQAYTFDEVNVSETARPGADTAAEDSAAMCVVDFGSASYAFQYTWEDGQTVDRPASTFSATYGATAAAGTGEAMMLTLASETELDVDYHYHDTLGLAVDGFAYDGQAMASDGWDTTFLGYWISGSPAWEEEVWAQDEDGNWYLADTIHHPATDGDGENWTASGTGVGGRMLSDGFFDGWSQEYVADGYSPQNVPATPVPEPATIGLLLTGAIGLLRRRRR